MTRSPARRARPGEVFFDVPPVEQSLLATPWFDINLRGGFYTVEPVLRAALVCPVLPGEGVVLVRVRRPLQNDCPLETPGGGVAENETAAEAARRELREETGIDIADLSRFQELPPICEDPSRSVRLVHILRVDITREEFDNRARHDHEIEEVLLVPFRDVLAASRDGRIYILGTLAVLMRGITADEWMTA